MTKASASGLDPEAVHLRFGLFRCKQRDIPSQKDSFLMRRYVSQTEESFVNNSVTIPHQIHGLRHFGSPLPS